jgi:hypothetical protein
MTGPTVIEAYNWKVKASGSVLGEVRSLSSQRDKWDEEGERDVWGADGRWYTGMKTASLRKCVKCWISLRNR